VLMEAARAYAALESRKRAEVDDVKAVALLVLRHRRSDLADFEQKAREEDEQINAAIGRISETTPATSTTAPKNGRKSASVRPDRRSRTQSAK